MYIISFSLPVYFSRTLTSVHENILEDLCFPSEIVGKRIRVKLDGSRLIKVHLEKTQQTNIEHKVTSFPHSYLLNQWLDFDQTCMDTLLGDWERAHKILQGLFSGEMP